MIFMNICVATLGGTWAIVPELIGFLSPNIFNYYAHHSSKLEIDQMRINNSINIIDELWFIVTDTNLSHETLHIVKQWIKEVQIDIPLRAWAVKGISDPETMEECLYIRDLIFRIVLHAKKETQLPTKNSLAGNNNLFISLAGGRKTMSADIQDAAAFFGCDALIHIVERIQDTPKTSLTPCSLKIPPKQCIADITMPVVITNYPGNPAHEQILPSAYPIDVYKNIIVIDQEVPSHKGIQFVLTNPKQNLAAEVNNNIQKAENLFYYSNFDLEYREKESSNFNRLFILPPHTIKQLRCTYIGSNRNNEHKELILLEKLPKAELHCHLGGILETSDMVTAAKLLEASVISSARQNQYFADWLENCYNKIKPYLGNNSQKLQHVRLELAGKENSCFKNLDKQFTQVPRHIVVAGLLLCFQEDPQGLIPFIYGAAADMNRFFKVGIPVYESFGDLQGTAILQTKAVIRYCVRRILDRMYKDNVWWLELRCSPLNYTKAGLTGLDVYLTIAETFKEHPIKGGIILIASRHRKIDEARQYIKLMFDIIEADVYPEMLLGFDLAGDEKAANPAAMRDIFIPVMERCKHITIHAGETAKADNIWEAVYHLSAERVGHGLTLQEHPELLGKFLDRRIGLELCPSSNVQIIGYQDNCFPEQTRNFQIYPLRSYLSANLKVSINSDNPGISRTMPSKELLRAARLCPLDRKNNIKQAGLSVMEILQLIKNSFTTSFADYHTRKKLILDAEESIITTLGRPIEETCLHKEVN